MTYPNRRKAFYFGLIFITSMMIIGAAIGIHHVYEEANKQYDAESIRLNETILAASQIQFEFKLQVQEWKNILLRGQEKPLYDKYYNSFIDQFVVTQDKAEALLQFIDYYPDLQELVKAFQLSHRSILADYQDALLIFEKSGFNAQLADNRVRGIDRKPAMILLQLNKVLQVIINQKIEKNKRSFQALQKQLAILVLFIQAILCLVLVRLTGKLLDKSLADPVTKAGNRNLFIESIKDALRKKQNALVAFIDINDFKVINAACGNAGGNAYLSEIYKKTLRFTTHGDVICRLSADLFGIVIFDTELESKTTLNLTCLEINEFEFEHGDIKIALSCSSSSYWIEPVHDNNVEQILNKLHVALQVAKSDSLTHLVHYDTENPQIAWLHKQLEAVHKVSELLQSKKCVLFKQAINPIQSVAIAPHYEILLRVENEKGGFDSPYLFLQTAERFNLIGKVDRYVLTSLVEFILDNPNDKSVYAINLSGNTLSDPSFVEFIRHLFRSPAIPTERLYFEITETEVIKNFKVASKILSCLTDYGCKISLDDFGTGMSSYAYLAKLSVDIIKIDGTFIKGIHNSPQNKSIVTSIVGLAKMMNIRTVAEFVEVEEELDTIKALRIDYAQGYYLNKPEFFYQPKMVVQSLENLT